MSDTKQDTDGNAAVGEAKAQAHGVAETGKSEAQKVTEEVKSQSAQLFTEAGSQAKDRAETQVGEIATLLSSASEELDQMAGRASDSNGYIASLARNGASNAKQVAERLERDGLDGALDEVRSFARRRPGAFVAGSFAVGLLLGRVTRNADLKSVADQARDTTQDSSLSTPTSDERVLPPAGAPRTTGQPTHDAGHQTDPSPVRSSVAPQPTVAEQIDPGLPA